jgi:hypothetical protein
VAVSSRVRGGSRVKLELGRKDRRWVSSPEMVAGHGSLSRRRRVPDEFAGSGDPVGSGEVHRRRKSRSIGALVSRQKFATVRTGFRPSVQSERDGLQSI